MSPKRRLRRYIRPPRFPRKVLSSLPRAVFGFLGTIPFIQVQTTTPNWGKCIASIYVEDQIATTGCHIFPRTPGSSLGPSKGTSRPSLTPGWTWRPSPRCRLSPERCKPWTGLWRCWCAEASENRAVFFFFSPKSRQLGAAWQGKPRGTKRRFRRWNCPLFGMRSQQETDHFKGPNFEKRPTWPGIFAKDLLTTSIPGTSCFFLSQS